METIDDLWVLAERVLREAPVYLRYSHGPERDQASASRDYEADVTLPGLPVTGLTPEPWWTRPPVDWVARRVCKYLDLSEQDPSRRPWVLHGRVIGSGPDHEPLLDRISPIAWLDPHLVRQAQQHYHARFHVGRSGTEASPGRQDRPDA